MKVAFHDEWFVFEFVRNLGFVYYGGADIGEMMAAAGRIKEGDFESWFAEWDKLARRILSRADASLDAGHLESAREGYLRASTYFRTAEFYLHGDPGDPRILSESRASQEAYARAADLAGPTWKAVESPYEGATLPGYLYKVDGSGEPRPTLTAASRHRMAPDGANAMADVLETQPETVEVVVERCKPLRYAVTGGKMDAMFAAINAPSH